MIAIHGSRPRFRSVVFDVDSTVAGIEGVDWLAMQCGDAVSRECAALTARAMAGEIPLESVYERRLQIIAPQHVQIEALATAYADAVQPGAPEVIAGLRDAGVSVHLLSGGLRDALLPLAAELGIDASHVHAVDLDEDERGYLTRLRGEQPLATQRGKPLVLSRLALDRPVVMIGDGSTDAATRGVVDAFFAYTGVARREAVVAVADAEVRSFLDLLPLLYEVSP